MNIKTTIPISEARKKIFQIAEAVQQPDTFYTLTEHGRPKAVILSAEEFESWTETLEVISEIPNLAQDIKTAHDDYAQGKFITLEELIKKEEKKYHRSVY